jgi:hypothetical protein
MTQQSGTPPRISIGIGGMNEVAEESGGAGKILTGEDAYKYIGLSIYDLGEAVERGGPGSGHFGHEGRPGEVGGSQPVAAGERQRGGQFDATKANINRQSEREYVRSRMAEHLKRSVEVGHGKVDEFYDRVRGSAPEGLWFRDAEGHTLMVVAADAGHYGWGLATVALGGIFAAETGERAYDQPFDAPAGKGSGMGTAFMLALKDYVDAGDKKLIVHSVANPAFFNRFPWLHREDSTTYRYQSLGYTLKGRGGGE